MKATVAFVVVCCMLLSSRPAAAQEPIESRSIVSEQVGLIAVSDGAPVLLWGWGRAQKPHLGGGIPNWKILVLGAAVLVVAVLAVRATGGNNAYQPPRQ